MDYQVACIYKHDGDEKTIDRLKIFNNAGEFNFRFNKLNLCRTIPYFIWCLNNNKKFTLKFDNDSWVSIEDNYLIFYMFAGLSDSTIKIPLTIKDSLIHELNKYDNDNISPEYIRFMNASNNKTILFAKNKLGINNDTGIFVIDAITDGELENFRSLITGNNIVVRGVSYVSTNGSIIREYNSRCFHSINVYSIKDIEYTLDNIFQN